MTRLKEPYQNIAHNVSEGYNEHLWTIPKELLEAYSDAIVQKCIEVMTEHINDTSKLLSYPPKSAAIWTARNQIEKHFGVKS